MRAIAGALVGLSIAGCGAPSGPRPGDADEVASAAPSASATVAVDAPRSLRRAKTPEARRAEDEAACAAGDAVACRHAADRYRGYGHVAGCGVARERPKPRRMVTAVDADADARSFDAWIRKACDLGDDDACVAGRANIGSHRVTDRDLEVCTRGALAECPSFQLQIGLHPEKEKVLREKRQSFLANGYAIKFFNNLFARDKPADPAVLPKDVADVALRVCASTLECDEVLTQLDEDGYLPEAIAPVRKAMGDALAGVCLEGGCVCGEAARLVDPGDPRREDLARLGCDDGEPDGCYVLGQIAEAKDVAKATALYQLACPSVVATDGREEIYSKAACDRLGQMYEAGQGFEKDSDRGFYYASLACTRVDREQDHAFCVRRALYHGRGYWRSDLFGHTPRALTSIYFFGDEEPSHGHECERPSVAALCKQSEKAIVTAMSR